MVSYNIGQPPEDQIALRSKFIVDNLLPLCIEELEDNMISILFVAGQDSTETIIFLKILYGIENQLDKTYISLHPLNMKNISNDFERIKFYSEMTKDFSEDKLYFTTLEMHKEDLFYSSIAMRKMDRRGHADVKDLYIRKDMFIRYKVFEDKFINCVQGAELAFTNPRFKNVSYTYIDHSTMNATTKILATNLVYSHYVCGRGPTQFKFNTVTPAIPGLKLRVAIGEDAYLALYGDEPIITDILYDEITNTVLLLYDKYHAISGNFIGVEVIVYHGKFLDKCNFLDPTKIYERETDNEDNK